MWDWLLDNSSKIMLGLILLMILRIIRAKLLEPKARIQTKILPDGFQISFESCGKRPLLFTSFYYVEWNTSKTYYIFQNAFGESEKPILIANGETFVNDFMAKDILSGIAVCKELGAIDAHEKRYKISQKQLEEFKESLQE